MTNFQKVTKDLDSLLDFSTKAIGQCRRNFFKDASECEKCPFGEAAMEYDECKRLSLIKWLIDDVKE